MTRQATTVFGIDTVNEYLQFCSDAVAEFKLTQDSVLRAFTAILALNHVTDWLQYKLTSPQRQMLALSELRAGESVKAEFEARNSDIVRVREIANGFKHLRINTSTQKVGGYGVGPWGIGPYGTSYLLIDLGDDKPADERWDVALCLCERVLSWWRSELSLVS